MILDEIISWKRREVQERKAARPLAQLLKAAAPGPRRPFEKSLVHPGRLSILAEIKRASPSAGVIRSDIDVASVAPSLERAGAQALSVLTDEKYFCGSLADMTAARSAVTVPVLEKDFVVDPYQVYEAAAAGADAILLIVRTLSDDDLEVLLALVSSLGLGCLVETHTPNDVRRALDCGIRFIGINNRDLATFKVDIAVTLRLMPEIPAGVSVVSQSGISSAQDAKRLYDAGVSAIQVGESIMRAGDPAAKIGELLSLVG